ncbi:hypothetical protein NPIL_75951, partial [Nephila pilipes]
LEKKFRSLFPEAFKDFGQNALDSYPNDCIEKTSPTISSVLDDLLDKVPLETLSPVIENSVFEKSPLLQGSTPRLSSTPMGNLAPEGSILNELPSPNLSLPLILAPLPPIGDITEEPATSNMECDVTTNCTPDVLTVNIPDAISPIRSPCQEKSPSILDIILSQEFYSREASPEYHVISSQTVPQEISDKMAVAPPAPVISIKDSITPCQTEKEKDILTIPSYSDAARDGYCKLCKKSFLPAMLLAHLNTHRPCTKRFKCIKAVVMEGKRVMNQPAMTDTSSLASTSSTKPLTEIEKKFREKFPELPVFQKKIADSPSDSSDRESLLSELDSPPTGPPTKPAFTKKSYSSAVRKGLFRCKYCETPFVSKSGMENHILKIHNISPSPPTQAKIPSPPGRPYCKTCNKLIEGKISMADHCKLHHNLEISTNRSSPVSKIVKVPNAPAGQPTKRQVNNIDKGKLKVSFGVLPSKPPGKSNSITNSNNSNNGTQSTRIFSSKDGSSAGSLIKKSIHDHQSDSSMEDFSIPNAKKHQNAQQGSPTK